MLTVTVASGKGGTCKSTLTAALAVTATKEAERVALIDLNADQSSLTNWWRRRGEPANPYLLTKLKDIRADLRALASIGFAFCLIDTPPDEMKVIESAIKASNAVVIPVRPSRVDIEAAAAIVGLCQDHRKPFGFLLAAVDTRPQFRALTNDALADLNKATRGTDGQVLSSRLPYRREYIMAMADGKTGHEIDTSLEREVARIWAEVKGLKGSKHV